MFNKKSVEDEKAKLLAELKTIETEAEAKLAEIEAKAKGMFDLSAELAAVEETVKADVQKVEKWFVSVFKKPTSVVEPVVEPTPAVVEPTPVVEPTANTAAE